MDIKRLSGVRIDRNKSVNRISLLKDSTLSNEFGLAVNAEKGDYSGRLFENLPELLTPELAAVALHTTRATVYQWHHRPQKYAVVDGMFLKFGRKLLIQREVLKTWVLSRNRNERNQ